LASTKYSLESSPFSYLKIIINSLYGKIKNPKKNKHKRETKKELISLSSNKKAPC
jgi:hypothetical protein